MSTMTERSSTIWKPNLSFSNRQLRSIAGISIIGAVMLSSPTPIGLWSVLLLCAIPLITTAITGWCPLQASLGYNSYIQGEEDIRQKSWTSANVGTLDRAFRMCLGVVFMSSLLTMNEMQAGLVVTLFAVPLIMTAITAWDPFYAILRVNSFASRVDVEAAEPEVNEYTLAEFYEFPKTQHPQYELPKAA